MKIDDCKQLNKRDHTAAPESKFVQSQRGGHSSNAIVFSLAFDDGTLEAATYYRAYFEHNKKQKGVP